MGQLKTVFLDFDGVLNEAIWRNDTPSAPVNLAELVIPEENKAALERLKAAGYLLIGVTNKPDIESGLMTQAALDAIIAEIRDTLPLDDAFICYHRDAACFKPKPGMLLDAQQKHHIDMSQSFMIGDRPTDIECGKSAGVKTIWYNRHYPINPDPDPAANFTVNNLTEAVDWILR